MSPLAANDTRFVVSDDLARDLAARFGTPTYVLSERILRERASRFVSAWPGDVSFASKANNTWSVLKIAFSEGCSIDVASEGELRAALGAGVPAQACRLHGNNKSLQELTFAVNQGVGKIIVDCFEEIERLKELSPLPVLLLRVAPGVDPKTHHKISTGQADTKFGFAVRDVEKAVARCRELGMPLAGLHCHVGSQLLDAEAQVAGAETLVELAVRLKKEMGFVTTHLNVGGGLGVRYTNGDEPVAIEDYCRDIVNAIRTGLKGELDPELGMEPGRSLVAEAGVTLYTVGAVKTAANGRVYVAVDGGLSDNPRPALYGSKYDLVWHASSQGTASHTVTVSGKHCETDTLFPDVQAPVGLQAGDLVQILSTGAYNSVMASNYNALPRPATILVREDGRTQVVQVREQYESMFVRESVPEDL